MKKFPLFVLGLVLATVSAIGQEPIKIGHYGSLTGKDAVRQWMQTAYVEAPDFELHRMIADGEFVAALGEIMVKDGQGQPVRHSYCDVWRFRDGLMAELRAFVIKAL